MYMNICCKTSQYLRELPTKFTLQNKDGNIIYIILKHKKGENCAI